jgi:hypothetical protein
MKAKYIFMAILFSGLIFSGCEEVIQVDLNSSKPAVVIEAKIYDVPDSNGLYTSVMISKSTDYFVPGIYPKVDNAEVTVHDDMGNVYQYVNLGEGLYVDSNLVGTHDHTYFIDVKIDGKTYSAESYMPMPVFIDSVYYQRRPAFSGKKIVFVNVMFQDDPNTQNYERIKTFINNKAVPYYSVFSDRLTNGNSLNIGNFLGIEGEDLFFGDTITVQIEALDEAGFQYFKTLQGVQADRDRGGRQVAPSNPVTNWSNGAFGYFSAMAITRSSIVLGF